MRPTTLALALLLVLTPPALADVVYLKNGRTLEGKVLERSAARVKLKTLTGVMELPMQAVLRIDVRDTPEEELGDRAAATDMHDPAAIEALAMWASSRGLGDEGRDLLALSRGMRLERLVARAQALDDPAEFLAAFHWARVNEGSDEVLDWLLSQARARSLPDDPAVDSATRQRRADLELRARDEARRQELLRRPRYVDPEQQAKLEASMGVTLASASLGRRGDPARGAALLERARAARAVVTPSTTPSGAPVPPPPRRASTPPAPPAGE